MISRTFTKIALVAFMLSMPQIAHAGADFCDTFPAENRIVIGAGTLNPRLVIKNKLAGYHIPQYLYSHDGKTAYCLVFQINADIDDFVEQLSLTVADGTDVYIKGLNVRAADALTSLLKITNDRSDATVYLLDSTLTNVENGITIEGTGKTELHGVNVLGDTSKAGPCISLKAPGAVLDDVEAKGCGVGVKVEANGARITSSGDVMANLDPATQISNNITNISENEICVHIVSGATGTKITRSRIFGCDDTVNNEGTADGDYTKFNDMIRMDGGSPTRLVFFDGEGQNIAPVDEDMTKVVDYGNRPVYINVPLGGTQNVAGNVTIDFFAAPADQLKTQAYNLIDIKVPVEVPVTEMAKNAFSYLIPEKDRNKKITAIYNDPLYGTTSLSQSFTSPTGIIVIFVDSPFDQTSQGNPMGGGTETGGAGTTGGGEIATVQTPADPAATGGGSSGAVKAKLCSFIPDDAPPSVSWPAALWWLLLLSAPAAGLATVRAKIKNRRSET